jgi:WS/DGAT C-terminal domain/TAP-like protein
MRAGDTLPDRRLLGAAADSARQVPPPADRFPLEQLRVPTLVISARDDPPTPYRFAAQAASRLLGAQLVTIEQGGHLFLGTTPRCGRKSARSSHPPGRSLHEGQRFGPPGGLYPGVALPRAARPGARETGRGDGRAAAARGARRCPEALADRRGNRRAEEEEPPVDWHVLPERGAPAGVPALRGPAASYEHLHRHRSRPPVPLYLAGAPLVEMFPVVPILGNVSLGIGVLSYAGQFNITVVADRDICPDAGSSSRGYGLRWTSYPSRFPCLCEVPACSPKPQCDQAAPGS